MASVTGKVGTHVFDVNRIIESAYKRCRIPPSAITGEQAEDAIDTLALFMAALPTKAETLWAWERPLVGMVAGRPTVQLPAGTIEITRAARRVLSRHLGTVTSFGGGDPAAVLDGDPDTACTHVAADGYLDLDLGEPRNIVTIGVTMASDMTATLKVLTSMDGVTWRERLAFGACAFAAGEPVWREFDRLVSARYVRLQETGGATLNVAEWVVADPGRILPISRSNVDQYATMPDRFALGEPTSYWVSRSYDRVTMNLWPAPNQTVALQCLEVYTRRLPMDVGGQTNILEVPLYWYEAIVSGLALKIALSDEKVQPALVAQLQGEANTAMAFATAQERDRSPVVFRPNIARYTR